MTEPELETVVRDIAAGEDRAFEQLHQSFRWHVFHYLRRLGADDATAEDALQDCFLQACVAMRSGKYQHHGAAPLAAWLRTSARHALSRLREQDRAVPLVESADEELADPLLQVPDRGPGPAALALNAQLFNFLADQLDEALIHSQTTQKGKDLGLLKKLTFLRFYVDRLPQKEVLALAVSDAAALGVLSEITSAAINNWISRGDVLRCLTDHLADKCPRLLDKLSKHWADAPGLDPLERRCYQLHWERDATGPQIAESMNISREEAARCLSSARQKVARSLFRHVKEDLHELRFNKVV
jgi:DNA-directed RNA polymerase specialized sigma24 family protein